MKWTEKPEAGCRFYVLEAADAAFVQTLGLRVRWRDGVSGSVVGEAAPEKRR